MEESVDTWYSLKDLETFKRDRRDEALQLIESGGTQVMEYLMHHVLEGWPLTAIEKCCFSLGHFCGLETALVHSARKSLLSMRAATRKLVLSEQARQRVMNEKNVELLAIFSMKTTEFARDWARMTAVINEMTEW
ncbi:hypothetical protein HJC23_012564 [Cyclotella cryptica]|uniref:Uncharacterized protein n=1 Tax=Cyclotella cryptica TaxID=29204 RepID=A0ABD3QWY8_9STRA|eukprot:CCRYP_003230-RA/>CCRYP_003230-RA protein AED:0.47 eAED:0.47 QI:0/-1/0/1/-1/1/1/0/134